MYLIIYCLYCHVRVCYTVIHSQSAVLFPTFLKLTCHILQSDEEALAMAVAASLNDTKPSDGALTVTTDQHQQQRYRVHYNYNTVFIPC